MCFLSYINICHFNSVLVLLQGESFIFLFRASLGFGLFGSGVDRFHGLFNWRFLNGLNFGGLRLSSLNLGSLCLFGSNLLFSSWGLLNDFRLMLLGALLLGLLHLSLGLFGDVTLLPGLLLAREIRIQKYHAIVHNLEVLAQQTEVSVELAQQRVHVRHVNLNHERFSALLMLGLDY